MLTAKVKKWTEFQHYKNRSPPWIKLQKSIVDDFEYARLPLASKALAPLLWLLASESMDGEVCIDHEWLAFRLRFKPTDVMAGLTPLIEKGFLIVDSTALASCKQVAGAEGETEGEGEGEEQLQESVDSKSSSFDHVLSAYHDILPKCQRVSVMNPKRKRRVQSIVTLAKSICKDQGWPYDPSGFWPAFFSECAKDAWMRGEIPNPKNPTWKQNLDVLLAEDRFAGVMDKAISAMRAQA